MARSLGDQHWLLVTHPCWDVPGLAYEDWFPDVTDSLNQWFIGAHFYYFYEWEQAYWTVADAQANADSRFTSVLLAIQKHGRPWLSTELGATPFSPNYECEAVPGYQYCGAAGYSTVSLAFVVRMATHFNANNLSYTLYACGDWVKNWSLGWHYDGLYGGVDVWGQYLP